MGAIMDNLRGYQPAEARREIGARLLAQHANRGLGAQAEPRTEVKGTAVPQRLATPRQLSFVRSLLDQLRTHNPEVCEQATQWLKIKLGTLTVDQASDVITRLRTHLDAPATVAAAKVERTGMAEVLRDVEPERRYALQNGDDPSSWRFYTVKLSAKGNKYIKIGHANGVSIAWSFLPVERGALDVAKRIAADPREAMLNYGRQIGRCGHCDRTLTNDESRALGIGPICRNR